MKSLKSIIITLLTLTYATSPVQAAKVNSLEDAYSRAKDKPIMVYCYAANFNESNIANYEKLMKRRAITKGIQQMTYLELPIYQNPDKNEKRKADKAFGKAGMPGGVKGLPCVIILDKNKNLRGFIRDTKILNDPELANKELKKLVDVYTKQQKLLDRAASTKGGRKADLIVEASELSVGLNLNIPGSDAAAAAAADAGNKEGYAARFSLSFEAVLPELDKLESNGAATNYIRGMLSRGKYTKIQQQELLCTLSGYLRRNGASATELRKIYQEMNQIDPETYFGAYAKECIRQYCTE